MKSRKSINGCVRPAFGIAIACLGTAACGTGPEAESSSAPLVIGDDIALDASARLEACARLEAYVAARADADGLIQIGGKKHVIKAGTNVRNAELLVLDATVCVDAKLDASLRIVDCAVSCGADPCGPTGDGSSGGSSSGGEEDCGSGCAPAGGGSSGASSGASPELGGTIDLCGTVDACVEATAATSGQLSIGGCELPIGSGVSLLGDVLLRAGASVCVHAELDKGAICAPPTVTLNLDLDAKVRLCGAVNAYVAAGSAAAGSVSVGGPTLRIKAGARLDGDAKLVVGANVCVDAALDGSGYVTAGTVVAR